MMHKVVSCSDWGGNGVRLLSHPTQQNPRYAAWTPWGGRLPAQPDPIQEVTHILLLLQHDMTSCMWMDMKRYTVYNVVTYAI